MNGITGYPLSNFNMKKSIKTLVGKLMRQTFGPRIFGSGASLILMYHRVVESIADSMLDKNLYVTVKSFSDQLKILGNEFQLISLKDWMNLNDYDGKYCILTFDDGWLDNYQHAFPILLEHKIPATIFLTVNLVDTMEAPWFENLRHILTATTNNQQDISHLETFFRMTGTIGQQEERSRNLTELYFNLTRRLVKTNRRYVDDLISQMSKLTAITHEKERSILNWQEIRHMSENGITFGSHGLNHYAHTILDSEQKRQEIFRSKIVLEEADINFVPVFSFPNGLVDTESMDIIKAAGYKAAFVASKWNLTGFNQPHLYSRICISELVAENTDLLAWRLFLGRLRREMTYSQVLDVHKTKVCNPNKFNRVD